MGSRDFFLCIPAAFFIAGLGSFDPFQGGVNLFVRFLPGLFPHGPAQIPELMLHVPDHLADFAAGSVQVFSHFIRVKVPVKEPAQETAEEQAPAEITAASAEKTSKQQYSQPGGHDTSPFVRETPGMGQVYSQERRENRAERGKYRGLFLRSPLFTEFLHRGEAICDRM